MLLRYRHRSKRGRFHLRPRRSITRRGRHEVIKNSHGTEAIRIETTTAMATSDQSDFGIPYCTWTMQIAFLTSRNVVSDA